MNWCCQAKMIGIFSKTIFFIYALLKVFTSQAQDLTWEPKSGIPEFGLNAASFFTINNKLYVVNGFVSSGGYSKSLWAYNPATNIWTKKSNYPGSGSTLNIAFSINGKGYVGLGGSPSARHSDFYEYNPTTNSWTQKANFPGGVRYDASTFVIGDTAYLVGGSCGTFPCFKNDLWMYVPSTDSWTQKENFPGGNISGPTTFSIGQFGYAGGGVSSSSSLSNNYYKYSPSTNSWTSITSMPGTGRRSAFAFVLNNKAYATTGAFDWSDPALQNDGYVYNPTANTWTHFECNSDFTKRYVSKGVTLNDSTVLAGLGVDQNGFFLSDLWQLNLNYDTCDYYDTVSVTVYDTTRVVQYISVEDTLDVWLIGHDGCGDILLQLYPNPSRDIVYLYTNKWSCFAKSKVELVDQLGQVLETKQYTDSTISFDISGYARALYYIRIVNERGDTIFYKKLMIE